MAATNTSALELMDGKYRLWYRTDSAGGRLPGEFTSLLEARNEAYKYEGYNRGMTVLVYQYGRFR